MSLRPDTQISLEKPSMTQPTDAITTTLVLGGLVVALFLSPPLTVLVRNARPILSTLGLLAWLGYRLLSSETDAVVLSHSSLLRILIKALDQCQEWSLSKISSATPFFTSFSSLGWRLFEDLLAIILLIGCSRIVYCIYHYTWKDWNELIVDGIFERIKELPFVSKQLYNFVDVDTMNHALGRDPNRVITRRLPSNGRPPQELVNELDSYATNENQKWVQGKVSGTVYPKDEQHTELMVNVYKVYSWANPLHFNIWPKLNQCEGELIAMTANLLHGHDQVVGCTSSGGTESIMLAIRAHLNYYGKRRGIAFPELICCSTAHAAVDKACDVFGIRKVCISCDPNTFTLSSNQVRSRITSNTILIYASAPCYPQGVIDPIEQLGQLALEYSIGLHVDACLGGFILPFCKPLGYEIPKFDFECPGVTSMSVDTHKYGYASKGTSVVLYRTKELRHGQYFSYSKWSGGMYSTPTFAGSRPGALLACAWAALMSIGESGYQESAKSIIAASQRIAQEIRKIRGLRVLGDQMPTMIVCFTSDDDDVNIYSIGDVMTKKGWCLNDLQLPACIHLCVTLNVVPRVDTFLQELTEAVDEVRAQGPVVKKKGNAKVYGMVGSVPEGPVNQILRIFTDLTLTP